MRLSFSVGVKVPSSLVNIFKELKQDLGCTIPSHSGILEKLAVQRGWKINTTLPNSAHLHKRFQRLQGLKAN
ncbi:uracil-DNA glycosylase [Trifolium repens]|nr:uracil-DNA glycosylase, mitochondrial [Trifolium repens]WJX94490.1 uracil-DNA glycosylase [Trifolium repens]